MKDKKELLLVINDPLEFKLLMNNQFYSVLSKKYNITLLCPFNKDKLFRKEILKEFPNIQFCNIWPQKKLCFLDKIIYWLIKEIFYVVNSFKSESCFQKTYLNLYYLFRIFVKNFSEDKFIIFLARFFNKNTFRYILKALIIPTYILFFPLNKYIYKYKYTFTKFKKNIHRFNYIFFGRTYSTMNISIYKMFSNSNTKLIGLCRNFDSPGLKGLYTIPVDYTVIFDKYLKNHLLFLNNPLNYGKIMLCNNPISCFGELKTEKKGHIKQILYATSSFFYIFNECEIIKLIYNLLSTRYGNNFKLFIRIHANDNISNYDDVNNFKNIFFITKLYAHKFKGFDGKLEYFPIQKDIENFYNFLQKMDLILSCGSTINYEAHILRIKSAFLKLNKRNDWVFKRDHIKILNKDIKIPIIEDLRDLDKNNLLP